MFKTHGRQGTTIDNFPRNSPHFFLLAACVYAFLLLHLFLLCMPLTSRFPARLPHFESLSLLFFRPDMSLPYFVLCKYPQTLDL